MEWKIRKQVKPKDGQSRVLLNQESPKQKGRRCAAAAQSSSCIEFFHSQHYLDATFTVTLLFARFESSCGEAVWTVAVFAINWAGPEAATVSVIVA